MAAWADGAGLNVLTRRIVHHEVFQFVRRDGRRVAWDITLAKARVVAGELVAARTPIGPEALAAIAAGNEWTEAGVAAADPSQPGIGAPLCWQGEIVYQLIDACTGRCARCGTASRSRPTC